MLNLFQKLLGKMLKQVQDGKVQLNTKYGF